ncbi:hypothetical protein HGRIS_012390 [Hohenbuehelia grisea]|uniref:Uncharacterized protein n=1 Tax=Hohenbuehelia grisea TaxID=104357 RepID=A0ABR3IS73_9AGAR
MDKNKYVGRSIPFNSIGWLTSDTYRRVKNARLLSEFREIDSYWTSSDEDDDERPSLAQKELDNSVLRMGRALLDAAQLNPVEGTSDPPRVTLRLTRLNPSPEDDKDNDPRIQQTIDTLRDMGIDVEFGERPEIVLPKKQEEDNLLLRPTPRVNLDLSVLIALVSDLTHASLPTSVEGAKTRFVPAQSYRAWKHERNKGLKTSKRTGQTPAPDPSNDDDEAPPMSEGLAQHSRALSSQLLQEMSKGLLHEMHDHLSAVMSSSSASSASSSDSALLAIEFWTTPEARERCIRIIAKIGGVNEKRRAHALFPASGLTGETITTPEQSEEAYWRASRHSRAFIPLLPIRIFPSATPTTSSSGDIDAALAVGDPRSVLPLPKPSGLPPFFRALGRTCEYILAQETAPHPRALEEVPAGEIQRAAVTRLNARLTAHTVESMLWGAELGWTTLTANKTSVKAILKEMKAAKTRGDLDGVIAAGAAIDTRQDIERAAGADLGVADGSKAAIWVVSSEDIAGDRELVLARERAAVWVVDPRSLAEGMRSDYAP